ncbi:hypothetical protein MRB53_033188 [Persea americana]|uniref:Uncharacterized protein n=1 Tax=Persea americana TaxID=3435 RepID=A0ACC2KUI9_PERAE|nr:hypothetical protein MRB53_033188 [Persea americana]
MASSVPFPCSIAICDPFRSSNARDRQSSARLRVKCAWRKRVEEEKGVSNEASVRDSRTRRIRFSERGQFLVRLELDSNLLTICLLTQPVPTQKQTITTTSLILFLSL